MGSKNKKPRLRLKDGEISDKSMLDLGKYLANAIAEEVKKSARDGTLGELTGRTGATDDKTKKGDEIGDKVIKGMKGFFSSQKIGSVCVYSEEKGVYKVVRAGKKGIFMAVDPLDGSNNLRKGVVAPYVSVSVALGRLSDLKEEDTFDSVRAGVVRDIFNNRLYYATKGEGSAYVYDMYDNIETRLRTYDENRGEVTVYTETELEKSVIGIDLDRAKGEARGDNWNEMQSRLGRLRDILSKKLCQRRLGSSILDFCKVACGEYDSFMSLGGRMKLHDLAAASRIIAESGGVFQTDEPYEGNLLHDIFAMKNRKDAAELLTKTVFKAGASANPQIHAQENYNGLYDGGTGKVIF